MTVWERKLVAFVRKHFLVLIVIFATLGTMYARYCFRGVISQDMEESLLVWFKKINNRGGLRALGKAVGNYNIPYQTIIAVFTYLPFRPEYMYKGLSIFFDYLLAWAVAQLVYDLTRERLSQAIAYVATAALPIVILNSAAWGQCDSIYTFFCVLTILLMLREKYVMCFIAFGAAFSFKLQAVFLLPFLMFAWFYRERFSLWHFLLAPAVEVILCLPGVIAGQGLYGCVDAYIRQAGIRTSKRISWNYPSFWNLSQNTADKDHFTITKPMAIITTMLVLLCIIALLLRKRSALSDKSMTGIAFIMIFTCVYFLPSMHERYSYLYVIIGLVIAIMDITTLPAYLGLLFIDMQTYGAYLFQTQILPWPVLAALNLAIYAFYTFKILVPIVREPA